MKSTNATMHIHTRTKKKACVESTSTGTSMLSSAHGIDNETVACTRTDIDTHTHACTHLHPPI